MTFSEGLEGWLFGGSFTEHSSQSHWQDYTCAVEHGTAIVCSAVPEPAGFAFLGQEVFADDFRGSTVVFRGEFRVQADTPGRAGLFLRVNEGHSITGPMTERSVFADPDNNITRSRTPATGRDMRSPRGCLTTATRSCSASSWPPAARSSCATPS